MPEATVLVCGLPRSGSSLTMRMLHRGGLPVVGTEPDYEDQATLPGRLKAEWLATQRGKAVKVLDPQRHPATLFDPDAMCVIFLVRDVLEQAASQMKFMKWSTGVDPGASRRSRRALVSSCRSDTAAALSMLRRAKVPMLVMPFEYLVQRPAEAAEIYARFIEPVAALDREAMASTVVRRSPRCLPTMLEHIQLVDLHQRGLL